MKPNSSLTSALFILVITALVATTIGQQQIVESKLEHFLKSALEEFPNILSKSNQSQPNTTDEILSSFGTPISQHNINQTVFQLFLKSAIEKFPTWIRNNSLDPTSPNPEKYNFDWLDDSSRLKRSIRNEKVASSRRPLKVKLSIRSDVRDEFTELLKVSSKNKKIFKYI